MPTGGRDEIAGRLFVELGRFTEGDARYFARRRSALGNPARQRMRAVALVAGSTYSQTSIALIAERAEECSDRGPFAMMHPELLDHYEIMLALLQEGRLVPFLGAGVNLCGRPRDPNDPKRFVPWKGKFLPSGSEAHGAPLRKIQVPEEAG